MSDGFGFYVEEACAPHGVEVLTNAVDFTTRELRFPHEDRCCPCSTCGVCKQAPIKDAKYRGQTTVLVGDGASDRKAALLADVVFAKDSLASWCVTFGVPALPFPTLDDVRQALMAAPRPNRRQRTGYTRLLTPVRCQERTAASRVSRLAVSDPCQERRRSSSASVLPSGSGKNAIHSSSPAVPN